MSFEDPRGPLPARMMPQMHTDSKLQSSSRSFPHLPRLKVSSKPKKTPCYDWIFSSATDMHIVIDKTWFKTFTPFDTYVTTIAGQQPITVRGIGSVDLKIRCKPNSHQSRVISLENVLYVPGWWCNILSDEYFAPSHEHVFEHKWTPFGVQFSKKQNGKIKAWGYTETFCRLDRLVLSRKPHGRSPMLEDKDREVWSINLHWPSSQRDRWDAFKTKELQRLAKEHEKEILAQQDRSKQTFTQSTELLIPKNTDSDKPNPKLKSNSPPVSVSKVSVKAKSDGNLASAIMPSVTTGREMEGEGSRTSLSEVNANRRVIGKRDSDSKTNSLRSGFNANRGLLKEFLAVRDDDREGPRAQHQKQASIGKLVQEVEAATKGWSM